MIIFTCCEYYNLIHQDTFFMKITDKNLTQLSKIAMTVIIGRILAGVSPELSKTVIKGNFPLFLGKCICIYFEKHITASFLFKQCQELTRSIFLD